MNCDGMTSSGAQNGILIVAILFMFIIGLIVLCHEWDKTSPDSPRCPACQIWRGDTNATQGTRP